MDKNNEKNDKFYRKVAFLMYTEMVKGVVPRKKSIFRKPKI